MRNNQTSFWAEDNGNNFICSENMHDANSASQKISFAVLLFTAELQICRKWRTSSCILRLLMSKTVSEDFHQ